MKSILVLLLLCLFFWVDAEEIYNVELNNKKNKFIVQNELPPTVEITNWIIAGVIEDEKIVIPPDLLEKLSEKLLSSFNITYENFCKPNIEFMTQIYNALYKVLAGSEPKLVYEQDITEKVMPYEGFLGYVKRYDTKEKLEKFRSQMPTSMQVVVKSFMPQAKEIMLYWLLYRKIISSSSLEYDSLSADEHKNIERKWWQKKLSNLSITSQDSSKQEQLEQLKKGIIDKITIKNKILPGTESVLVEFFEKK